jgi:hypothetical protein
MSPVYESAVVRAVRGFKAALLAREAAQMAEMADRFLQVETALQDTIDALAARIAGLDAEGQSAYFAVLRMEQYQRLQLQIAYEVEKYNAWVSNLVTDEQLRFAGLGFDHSAATLETLRAGAAQSIPAAVSERITSMAGYAGDGSPLANLMDKSGALVRREVTRSLLKAVTNAQNPRITAREIRKATGMALNRALAISRTEQMRVYREATLAGYREAGVQLFQRISGRQSTSCIACISLDGEISTTEAELADHPAGFCVSLPLLNGVANPVMESSQAWFSRQPENVQRGIMGPTRLEMYRNGEIKWSELGRHTSDPVWGGSVEPVPVKELALARTAAA